MKQNVDTIIKNALIDYVKNHDEHSGTIMEFIDNIEGASAALRKLPVNLQNEIGQILIGILNAEGILTIPLRPIN